MPTYQYRCTECGEDLEAVQKFSDPTLTTCPTCSGQLRKVFNAVGVVFKGSGFYRTDSRNGSKSGADGDWGSDKSGPEKSGLEKSGPGQEGRDQVSRQEARRRGLRSFQRLQQWQAAGLHRSIIHRVEIRRPLALWTRRTIWFRVLNV